MLHSLAEVYFADSKFNIFDSIVNIDRANYKSNSAGFPLHYIKDKALHYIYNYRDAIIAINATNGALKKTKHASVIFENQMNANNLIISSDHKQIQYPDFLFTKHVVENPQYFFVTIYAGIDISFTGENIHQFVFMKEKGNTIHVNSLKNNIDYGMPFWPQWIRNDVLIDYYHPYQILDYYNETKESLEHSDAFIKLINNLNENDNPVLVFLTQK